METMWKGFSGKSTQRAAKVTNRVREPDQDSKTSEESSDDDCDEMKEGKLPMSPELFKNIYAAFFVALT